MANTLKTDQTLSQESGRYGLRRLVGVISLLAFVWLLLRLIKQFTEQEETWILKPRQIIGDEISSTTMSSPTVMHQQVTSENETIEYASDDLTAISGIGPVYARKLENAGIVSYAQLVALSDKELEEIIQPQDFQRLDVYAWRQQALELISVPQEKAEVDDFTAISGIGAVFADKLVKSGITSYEQLATMTPEQLDGILQAPAWRKPNYEDWSLQARRLSEKF